MLNPSFEKFKIKLKKKRPVLFDSIDFSDSNFTKAEEPLTYFCKSCQMVHTSQRASKLAVGGGQSVCSYFKRN